MTSSGIPTKDDIFDALLPDFLDESDQLLSRLNESLLQLDQLVRLEEDAGRPLDTELLNEMFRAAHSLKGLSGMLGLTEINQLTHRIENVFDAARRSQLQIGEDIVDILFRAVDQLGHLIAALRDPRAEQGDCGPILDEISTLLRAAGVERGICRQEDAERLLSTQGAFAESFSYGEAGRASGETAPLEITAESPAAPGIVEDRADAPRGVRQGNVTLSKSEETGKTDDLFAAIVDDCVSAEYLTIFVDEARGVLDELTDTLLAAENAGDSRQVEQLLVTTHRLKGSAAAVGLHRASKLAHIMEDLLQKLREGGQPLTPAIIDALLAATDSFRQYVHTLVSGGVDFPDFSAPASTLLRCKDSSVAKDLRFQESMSAESRETTRPSDPACYTGKHGTHPRGEVMQTGSPPQVGGSTPSLSEVERCDKTLSEEPEVASQLGVAGQVLASKLPDGTQGFTGVVVIAPNVSLPGLKARLVYEKLNTLGEIVFFHPEVCSLEANESELETTKDLRYCTFAVVTGKDAETVRRQLLLGGIQEVHLEAMPDDKPHSQEGLPSNRPEVTSALASAGAQSAVEENFGQKPSADVVSNKSAEPGSVPEKASREGAGPASETAPASGGGTAARAGETLRVDIERLDELMNLTGELVIQRARLSQIVDRLKQIAGGSHLIQMIRSLRDTLTQVFDSSALGLRFGGSDDQSNPQLRRIRGLMESLDQEMAQLRRLRSLMNDLGSSVHQLDRITDRIQQSVMNTRMVPIGPLFGRFKRVVRDLARANGKHIRLVILGEKTELDKRMIDELADPLIHLVRNAADHGIESPEERLACGKSAEGAITLDASHRGNSIVIEVRDDGRGLDHKRILRKAIEKGLASPHEAEKLSPQQIFQFIWEPGFSTAEKVTEISGRGMGMDIVRSKIEALNGTVDLASTPGEGTVFTIKLPLTLAILPSLMVRIDSEIFALPMEAVVEIVRLRIEEIATVQSVPTVCLRGRVIPLCRIQDIFRWNSRGAYEEFLEPGSTGGKHRAADSADVLQTITLVVLGERGREIAMEVDHVLGEEDLVIKSVGENYRHVPGIAGASILGDGRVALILDVPAVLEMSARRACSRVPLGGGLGVG